VRLRFHALAYNLGNFLRAPATPEPTKEWSPSSLRAKLTKIGAKVISHGRSITFRKAEYSSANVPGYFAADRRGAADAAAGANLRWSIVMCSPALTGGLRPDAEEEQTVRTQERRSGAGWQATRRQPRRDFRKAENIGTIRPNFRGHLGNHVSPLSLDTSQRASASPRKRESPRGPSDEFAARRAGSVGPGHGRAARCGGNSRERSQ
jgi:hypothetical protein